MVAHPASFYQTGATRLGTQRAGSTNSVTDWRPTSTPAGKPGFDHAATSAHGAFAGEKEAIDRLQAQYHSQLTPIRSRRYACSPPTLIERSLDDLPEVTLREAMSSTDSVNFVLKLEDVLEIDISDEQAENIFTFGDWVRFVESNSPNTGIHGMLTRRFSRRQCMARPATCCAISTPFALRWSP